MTELKGKIAVVTGASRGLGQRAAIRLGVRGVSVALVARSEKLLQETADMIEQHGGRAIVCPADLSSPDFAVGLKQQVESQLGQPSILVNAAGIFGPIQLIKDSDPQAWIETIMIDAISSYLTCNAFVGGMIEQKWGRIINVTSAASLHPPGPINSAYGTAKAALNQFTRHLAAEIEGTGVTANVMHPGDVKTDMFEYIRETSNKMGPEADAYKQWVAWMDDTGGDDPEKAADLILDLMSDAAASVNGQFLWIKDGLQAPIPSWGEPDSTQPWRK
jgi:NAD(P)-dependent dehydrogenase (short-subunit alcohol dehydrogenase family)